MTFSEEFSECQSIVEASLEKYLPVGKNDLVNAMRYSLLAGGKRIRPVLLLKFCEACNEPYSNAIPAACGIEMFHTYSLIHDDLPCMDNDDLRRGKPTCHVVYGYPLALLAGDALQAEAFKAVLSCSLSAERLGKMALELADAAGESGMCGGQYLDIREEQLTDINSLNKLHAMKTGALLRAACVMGVISAGGSDKQIDAASHFAEYLGIAFQIKDDILDIVSSTEELGKPVGSDDKNQKTTFPVLLGIDKCEELVQYYTGLAKESLKGNFNNTSFLCDLADYLAVRKK